MEREKKGCNLTSKWERDKITEIVGKTEYLAFFFFFSCRTLFLNRHDPGSPRRFQ